MKRIILCMAIFLCLSSTHSFADRKKQLEESLRVFGLFSNCQPMLISVRNLDDDALKIGLTKESINNILESRLRSAHLFRNKISKDQVSEPFLFVNVHVVARAFHISMEFRKWLNDPISRRRGIGTTWHDQVTGIHGKDYGYILSSISEMMDRFLVEFLRVNDGTCRKKK